MFWWNYGIIWKSLCDFFKGKGSNGSFIYLDCLIYEEK